MKFIGLMGALMIFSLVFSKLYFLLYFFGVSYLFL